MPAPVANQNATKSGVDSQSRIRPLARAHRRRVLRQLRLRASDLDPIGKAHLDAYAAIRSKLDLIDAYIDTHGLLRDDGEPQPALKLYVALQNSARLALTRLEEHFKVSGSSSMVVEMQRLRRVQ